jgi:hypothetical protein
MPLRIKRLLIASAAVAVALPVMAQNAIAPQPATNAAPSQPAPTPAPGGNAAAAAPARVVQGPAETGTGIVDADEVELPTFAPPVEYPEFARRDPAVVGYLDPAAVGLGNDPWNGASGVFLAGLMRRMDMPLASRWGHIALRNALYARAAAPSLVAPVNWVAERALLLVRMGEADAARMLVSGVDTDRFTPGMTQVAVQSALANADPAGLCPLESGIREVEPNILPLVQAMCSALAGEPEQASAQIDAARRRGKLSGIDLVLAQKVVGAGANTGRAVTVEWEPVERLNAWRFGLATATGMTFPERLITDAPANLRAWQARAPMIAPADRLASAKIATGLGVFSGQALMDLYALIYEATGEDDLPQTDSWQARMAFVGKDQDAKLAAMQKLWGAAREPYQKLAAWALLAPAAARIEPDADLQTQAPDLIASLLAAGLDRDAARWADAVRQMDDEPGDRAWAMLALGAPNAERADVSTGRINAFIGRDKSPERKRSALLVAGLLGLGRIDLDAANRLNSRYHLGLDHQSSWTKAIDDAAGKRQPGAVAVLAGTGLQAADVARLPSSHMLHIVSALRRTGQDFAARMIAAEALART